ncbi:PHD finger protein 13-like isoform X2 [Ischnura elegans]|uniref:PHD finger protein 13-like isoform X2 n=1 Tax=Ischnura elegans TaxID=197161 RepID=UPI001ED8B9E3|nr:PHD finger protein 13-like isoform X2 [Ischnura elegans]
MSEGVFKAPKSKKSMEIEDEEHLATTSKRPRTAEDFYMFCKFILEYENYDMVKQEELREKSGSPIGSTGSLSDSIKSESTSGSLTPDDRKGSEVDLDEDSYDLITCFCLKPFAGRPMIECSKCLTWIHLSCAKIKKTNIPEVFICNKCKRQNHTVRRPSLRSISGSSPPVRMKKKVSV